jgi:phosphatidylglycerol:prolipoprotein diacylglycerol transferase
MLPEILGVIKSYGLLLAVSFGLGLWLSIRRGRPYGLSSETIMDLVFGVLVSSIVGVRLMYVLTHLAEFDPWYRAFYLWDGGLTLYGGIILATATVWYMCRRRGVAFLDVADIFSPGVALGIGITRIGCFLAGCCFGKPTGCACAVTFPADAPASLQFGHVAVHPTQLYGSAAGFAIFGGLLLWERFRRGRGATFARFLMLYGVARFVEDLFRYYEPAQRTWLGWSNNQWVSVVLVAGGLALMATLRGGKAGEGRHG